MPFLELFEKLLNPSQVTDIVNILSSGRWVDFVGTMDYIYPQPKRTIQNICELKGYTYTTGVYLAVMAKVSHSVGEEIKQYLIYNQKPAGNGAGCYVHQPLSL